MKKLEGFPIKMRIKSAIPYFVLVSLLIDIMLTLLLNLNNF